jgi:LacI family transcriptional regulator
VEVGVKKTTIKDVAKEAGVSITIASFALNNVKGRVGEDTRQRVLEAAEKLGYIPNTFARNLRAGVCNTLALVYDESYLEERNASTLQFVAGAVKSAGEKGKDLLVKLLNVQIGWKPALEEYRMLWASQKVEGIVFMCSRMDIDFLKQLKLAGINFVIIPPVTRLEGFHSVYIDNYKLMRQGITAIHEKGYRTVYYLAMKEDMPSDRESGYIAAIRELGLKGHPLYYNSRYRGKGEIWETIREVVENRSERIAIACWNDVDAINVIDILHAQGIGIPYEVGVMGFDDIPSSEHTYPPLTTIRQPFDEMAAAAIQLLIDTAGNSQTEPISLEVPGKMVERSSI